LWTPQNVALVILTPHSHKIVPVWLRSVVHLLHRTTFNKLYNMSTTLENWQQNAKVTVKVRLATRSALQSRKWQLTGMQGW